MRSLLLERKVVVRKDWEKERRRGVGRYHMSDQRKLILSEKRDFVDKVVSLIREALTVRRNTSQCFPDMLTNAVRHKWHCWIDGIYG